VRARRLQRPRARREVGTVERDERGRVRRANVAGGGWSLARARWRPARERVATCRRARQQARRARVEGRVLVFVVVVELGLNRRAAWPRGRAAPSTRGRGGHKRATNRAVHRMPLTLVVSPQRENGDFFVPRCERRRR
jgi:hypothetical protein